MKQTKSKKGRKTKKSKTRTNRKRMRGGCCGERALVGGSAGLAELPVRHYYDLMDEMQNPARPAVVGGKKRRMRGGMSYFLLTGIGNDVTNQPAMNGQDKFYA